MAPPPVFLSLSAIGSGKVPILSLSLSQVMAVGPVYIVIPLTPVACVAIIVALPMTVMVVTMCGTRRAELSNSAPIYNISSVLCSS
jgi:uncharacterized protein YybS (DUF2232 family)